MKSDAQKRLRALLDDPADTVQAVYVCTNSFMRGTRRIKYTYFSRVGAERSNPAQPTYQRWDCRTTPRKLLEEIS